MKNVLYLWLTLGSIAVGCSVIQPQQGIVTGVVRGVKHYESVRLGAPIAGRQITLMDPDTGNVQGRMKTDRDGRFSFSVPPGKYSVWGGEQAEYVEVKAGETTTVDITAPEN